MCCISGSVQQSILHDLTLEMCVPIFLCRLAHRIQRNTPSECDAQRGSAVDECTADACVWMMLTLGGAVRTCIVSEHLVELLQHAVVSFLGRFGLLAVHSEPWIYQDVKKKERAH